MAWSDSPFNPKNWGGSSRRSSTPDIDTDTAVRDVINEGGTRDYTGGLKDDLTMGLSTVGLSYEEQAEKLSEMGYAPGAIEDYQSRTKATQEANRPVPRDDNDRPSQQQATPAEEEEATEEATSGTPTVDELISELEELSKQTFGGEFDPSFVSGPAEEEAMEFEEKGRRSTIKTSAQGIVDAPKKKKSLLAGA